MPPGDADLYNTCKFQETAITESEALFDRKGQIAKMGSVHDAYVRARISEVQFVIIGLTLDFHGAHF